MIGRVIILPLAVEDIASAATWYEEQSPGLGVDLTEEIIRAIRHAQEAPELFRIVRSRDGMRRILTERFPYASSSQSWKRQCTFMLSCTAHSTTGIGAGDEHPAK